MKYIIKLYITYDFKIIFNHMNNLNFLYFQIQSNLKHFKSYLIINMEHNHKHKHFSEIEKVQFYYQKKL